MVGLYYGGPRSGQDKPVEVFGYEDDVAYVEALFANTLIHGFIHELSVPAGTAKQKRDWQAAFWLGYADEIGRRLERAHAKAEESVGVGLVPLYANRKTNVEQMMREHYPYLSKGRALRVNDPRGYASGKVAGASADLGGQRLSGRRELA